MSDKPLVTKSFNEDLDVDEKITEGGVLARVFIEVQGNDEEAARNALESLIFQKLASEKNIKLLEVNMFNMEGYHKEDKEYFSGVVEVKLVADDFRWFVTTIMRYAPSAIEIEAPEEVKLNTEQMHALVSDVSGLTQMFSSQIMAMLTDDERRQLYNNMLEAAK